MKDSAKGGKKNRQEERDKLGVATNNREGLQTVHSVPGRTRLRFPKLKRHPHLVHDIRHKLCAIPGVHKVEVNASTSSIVIHHERNAAESLEFMSAMAAAFGLAVVEPEEILEMLRGESPNGSADLLEGIQAVGQTLNGWISQLTGGRMDTKSLMPTILIVLGMRSLFVSDVLSAPKWYEYFWFAFGAYFTLNKPESPGDAAT